MCRSRDYGKIYIDLPDVDDVDLGESNGSLQRIRYRRIVVQRRNNSHKSIYGNIGIIGDANGMGAGEGKLVKTLLAKI